MKRFSVVKSIDGCKNRFHVPVSIKQDSEVWSYVTKHKDIIEETEYYERQSEKQQDLKMNTLSLFALANRFMKIEPKVA